MKILQTLFFLLSCSILNIYPKHFFALTDSKDIKALVFTLSSDSQKIQNDYFFETFLEFPNLLSYAEHFNIPAILGIRKNNQNTKTTDVLAPLIEGSKVALTWANSNFRLNNNKNIKILLLPDEFTQNQLEQAIKGAYNTEILDWQVFENHVIEFNEALENSLEDKNFNLINVFFDKNEFKPVVIHPKVNPDQAQKRILIAGGAGFIGSHLVRSLLNKGHYIIVLDNLICSSKSNISDMINNPNFEFHQIDITRSFDVKGPIDEIVHLASIPSPEYYYRLPLETMTVDLIGTKNILDLALRKKAKILFASTSEVYGDPKIHPQSENYCGNVSPVGLRAPYDQSKRGAETLIKIYFEHYSMDARIVRIFNTYGPGMGMKDGRVVTNFIDNILESKPLKIYGDGLQTRSFAYVSDTVDGILKVLESDDLSSEKDLNARTFNVGNPHEFTILELAKKTKEIGKKYLNTDTEIKFIEQFDFNDPKQRRPDISNIRSKLNFNPSIELDEGLEKTFVHFLNQKQARQ